MSDKKITAHTAVNAAFEGQFRRRFLRELWFPIAVTLACMGAPLLTFGFGGDALPHVGNGFLFSLVFWGFSILSIQRDIIHGKYVMAVGKLDEVLENVGAQWAWCEANQVYAVHFTDDPHADESEETEESPEDPEDDNK